MPKKKKERKENVSFLQGTDVNIIFKILKRKKNIEKKKKNGKNVQKKNNTKKKKYQNKALSGLYF